MKIFTRKVGIPTIIAFVVVLLLAILSSPNAFNTYRETGAGNLYLNMIRDGFPPEQAKEVALQEGTEIGILMLLGHHIPFTILVLTMVGLISKSTTIEFKRILRFLYPIITVVGIIFLSLGYQKLTQACYSQAKPFSRCLAGAFGIYLGVSIILWILIGIGVAIRGRQRIDHEDKASEFMISGDKLDRRQR